MAVSPCSGNSYDIIETSLVLPCPYPSVLAMLLLIAVKMMSLEYSYMEKEPNTWLQVALVDSSMHEIKTKFVQFASLCTSTMVVLVMV